MTLRSRRAKLELLFPQKKLSKPACGHQIYPYLLSNLEITRAGRRVLCWRLSNTLDASFCVKALEETPRALPRPGYHEQRPGL